MFFPERESNQRVNFLIFVNPAVNTRGLLFYFFQKFIKNSGKIQKIYLQSEAKSAIISEYRKKILGGVTEWLNVIFAEKA